MSNDEPTFRAVVTAFTDFLVVAIHTILYERSVYPNTSFLSARKYNFAVRQNRHPKVCEWINDAVGAVENELLKGTVERVALVIFETTNNNPLERFVFDLGSFPAVQPTDVDLPLQRHDVEGTEIPTLPVVDMEQQFRAVMSKFSNCSSLLKPIPEGCSFTLAIELKDPENPPVRHPQPWLPVQPKGTGAQTTARPIRSVAAGEMVFEAWVEESVNQESEQSGSA